MKSKICTTIEQSRKLLELGVDVNTANMYYQYVLPKSDKIIYNPIIGSPIKALEWYNKGYTHFGKEPLTLNEYCIPCWSLAALLNSFKYNTINLHYNDVRNDWIASCTVKHSTRYESGRALNPVDACYEMILKLHELNLL